MALMVGMVNIDEMIVVVEMVEIVGFTMGQNRKKHRQNSYFIIHCPTSEGVSEVSE